MNTPLAMIVAGATIARTNIINALKNPRIYYVTALPCHNTSNYRGVSSGIIPMNEPSELAVLIAMSAPAAAMCTMQCLNYSKNSIYASEIFAVTTLLSTLTMPMIVYIYKL